MKLNIFFFLFLLLFLPACTGEDDSTEDGDNATDGATSDDGDEDGDNPADGDSYPDGDTDGDEPTDGDTDGDDDEDGDTPTDGDISDADNCWDSDMVWLDGVCCAEDYYPLHGGCVDYETLEAFVGEQDEHYLDLLGDWKISGAPWTDLLGDIWTMVLLGWDESEQAMIIADPDYLEYRKLPLRFKYDNTQEEYVLYYLGEEDELSSDKEIRFYHDYGVECETDWENWKFKYRKNLNASTHPNAWLYYTLEKVF